MSKTFKTEEQKKQSTMIIGIVLIILILVVAFYVTNLPVNNSKNQNNSNSITSKENINKTVIVEGVFKVKYVKSDLYKEHRIEKNIDSDGKKIMDIVFIADKSTLTLSTISVKPDYEFKDRVQTFPENITKPEKIEGLSNPNFVFIPEMNIRGQSRIVDTKSKIADTYIKQIIFLPMYGRSDMVINEIYANLPTEYVDTNKVIEFLKNITIE